MKKFKLSLEELKVNSFETGKNNSEKGTVKGLLPETTQCSKPDQESCGGECGETEYATCGATCFIGSCNPDDDTCGMQTCQYSCNC
ncbi:MAG: pinensin family lanthipeptide [Rhodothermaceae bacterium]